MKNSTGGKHVSPVLTSDASISINISISISIRSLCASEDSRDIGISISFLLRLMLMLMFSEDIVDISISARWLADTLTLVLMLMPTCPHWTL